MAIAAGLMLVVDNQMVERRAIAQIIPDGTLSTTVTSPDQLNFVIDAGDRAGNNLFHSFEQFSIPTRGSAQFKHAPSVETIIGRITGDRVSSIDGWLRTEGTADLFLINPNGFVFGPNARLDIGGSFVTTTADSIVFDDNVQFSAVNPQSTPLLSISTPIGLNMGTNPGDITLIGPGHQLSQDSDLSPVTDAATDVLGLAVAPGQNLSFIGGDVHLNGATLTASGGYVELGSAAGGSIGLNSARPQWDFTYDRVDVAGDVHLSQQALINVGGLSVGAIDIRAANFVLEQGSLLLSQNFGPNPAGTLSIHAEESVRIRGTTEALFRSSIATTTLNTGGGSSIDVVSPLVTIRAGGNIRASTFGPGRAGSVNIRAADRVQVVGASPFASDSSTTISAISATALGGTGDAGDIEIQTRDVRVQGGGVITSSTLLGGGRGGDIDIEADTIRLSGSGLRLPAAGITAATLGDGDAGNVRVSTRRLSIQDGNILDSSSTGSGDAGNVVVEASEQITVRGTQPSEAALSSSQLGSAVLSLDATNQQILGLNTTPSGNGGNLTITTPRLRVFDGGLVTVAAEGTGNAGQLAITADVIHLFNQGAIAAATVTGNGGNIDLRTDILRLDNGLINASTFTAGTGGNITVRDSIRIEVNGLGSQDLRDTVIAPAFSGTFQPTDITQGIVALALGDGQAGQIDLRTQQLHVQNGGIIATAAFDNSAGGTIRLTASEEFTLDGSVVSTSTFGDGNAGNLDVQTSHLLIENGGQLLAATFGNGDAGNLKVQASDHIVLRGRSSSDRLFASGFSAGGQNNATGEGGDVIVSTPFLVISDGAEISVSSTAQASSTLLNRSPQDRSALSAISPRQDDPQSGNSRSENSRSPSNLRPRASIPQPTALAGNIQLNVGTLLLDNGNIIARSDQGRGGDISLQADRVLVLQNESAISTQAGTVVSGGGDGGNIEIEAPFVVAFNNSDIVANAFEGDGGNIQVTTQGLFGLNFQEELTAGSDITASSAFGVSGTVSITTPDVTPTADVALLPAAVTDPNQRITTACGETAGSQFVATGRGGLPSGPDGRSNRLWANSLDDLGPPPPSLSTDVMPIEPSVPSSFKHPHSGADRLPYFDDSPPSETGVIREATAIAIAPNGSLALIAGTSRPSISSYESCSSR